MNPILKYGLIILGVIVLVMGVRGCGDDAVQDVNVNEPPVGGNGGKGGIERTASEELRTLSAKLDETNRMTGQMQDGFGQKVEELQQDQKRQAETLRQEMLAKVDELEKKQRSGGQAPAGVVTQTQLQESLEKLKVDMQGIAGMASEYATGNATGGSKNPLTDGQRGGFIIGGGAPAAANSETLVWVAPLDNPALVDKGKLVFDEVTAQMSRKAGEWGESLSGGVSDLKDKVEPVPVFTIPPNTTMVDAITTSRILARIPAGGTVESPFGFKITVPKTNLVANGLDIPDVSHAFMSGYAVGDFALSCARGYITNMTFVFEDGRIAQIGEASAQNSKGEIYAVLTDVAGAECVAGDLKTNAPAYLGVNIGLGALEGLSQGAVAAQTTTTKNNDGSSSTAPTGDTGTIIAGNAAAGGVGEAKAWVNERWANSFDAILVEIGEVVNIEIKKQINIDYDPNKRKIRFRSEAEAIEIAGDGEWSW